MRCIIIDNDPSALALLEEYISKIAFLELVASCFSGFEAMAILEKNKIDLIFTDIELPNFSGIDIIKSSDNYKLMFIITTAHPHYAIEGFNLNVTDYLMKPIPFHRFLKSAIRALDLLKLKKEKTLIDQQFIFVKSEYENLKINLDDIKYIESLKDYVKIYTDKDKPILTLNSLKKLENKLNKSKFIRVHKSYLVSFKHIYSVQRNRIVIDNKWIPIGLNYKDEFLKKIRN